MAEREAIKSFGAVALRSTAAALVRTVTTYSPLWLVVARTSSTPFASARTVAPPMAVPAASVVLPASLVQGASSIGEGTDASVIFAPPMSFP